jgi:hypothetical protein
MNGKQNVNVSNLFLKYSIVLFCLLFIYVLIRSLLNEPLHDEVATFLNYVEGGRIFGEGVIQDAQNHLFNTYLSRLMYLIFGDHFFFLRVPNLLSFVLYFIGIYRISTLLNNVKQQIILLTALSTVTFVIEYFAYSRGYGIGISFFIWMLIYTREWLQKQTIKNALRLYLFAYLSVFSNLIFFPSILLAMFVIVLFHFKNRKLIEQKKNKLLLGLHIGFFLSIVPFVWFSYLLKMGGALYYGSLNGFWEVTGKSLSIIVFFNNSDFIKYIYLLLFIAFIGTLIFGIIRLKFWNQIKEIESVLAFYFFGNIIAILLLATLFKVNYPEDRIGIYLIPLFILLFAFTVVRFKYTKSFIYFLLFFPISFVLKMNIHSSVFSPEDRMTNKFYEEVRSQINPETILAVYPVGSLTWAYHERNHKGSKINAIISSKSSPFFDVYITKMNKLKKCDLFKMKVIASDENGLIALKRNKELNKTKLIEYKIPHISSRDKEIKLMIKNDLSTFDSKNIQIQTKGLFRINKSSEEIRIKVDVLTETNKSSFYSNLNHRWLEGFNKLNYSVNESIIPLKLKAADKKLFINIWNPQRRLITFKCGSIVIYELNSEKDIAKLGGSKRLVKNYEIVD